jgi:acetolactate synthase-1/2/3 large subunit
MQSGQRMVTNKGLASMGYGLSGAIGAAIASGRRTILVEGDGGFSQNLQEIGTAAVNDLDLKIFIFDDNGYASIRSVQVNYFQGRYVGCDRSTGLGLPDWSRLFNVWDVPSMRLAEGFGLPGPLQRPGRPGLHRAGGPAADLFPAHHQSHGGRRRHGVQSAAPDDAALA